MKHIVALFSLLVGLVFITSSTDLTTQTAVLAQDTQGGGSATLYLPFLSALPSYDLAITNIEVTQSVQTPNHQVPLVAQRHTLVRVFAQTIEGVSPSNVVVTLQGVRNGNTLGTLSADPRSIPTNPSRADFSSTVNFTLPASWLSGNVTLIANVNLADANASNNVRQHVANFNSVPALRVVIVPIRYTHTPTNQTYPAQSVDYISDWIQRSFPVHDVQVTMRTPHSFTGDLRSGNEWGRLLDRMYILKQGDGFSDNTPVFYYGFVPINNGSTQWFSSGIAGIGWVSPPDKAWRESVGINLGQNDNTGILAAHEFGHNMGRYHAPCGGPAGIDPGSPYTGASIGQFGYDVGQNALRNPATHRDVMSYCGPEWTSDYTYNALYADQTSKGNWPDQANTTSQQLLIRATLDQSGGVELQPAYSFTTSADTRPFSATLYEVQLLDAAGAIIAQHPISLRMAEEPGVVARSFLGTVPLPSEPVASMQIVSLAGESPYVLAGQSLTSRDLAARTEASLTETAVSIHLSWGNNNRPALVRYTADEGATWTTLAVDHMGGELVVDKEWLEGDSLLDEQANGRFEIILANGINANVLSIER